MAKVSRTARRERAVARVKKPIPPALKAQDPLLRSESTVSKKLGWLGLIVVVALVLHVVVLVSFGVAATLMKHDLGDELVDERIEVAVIDTPPPAPEPEPEPEPEAAPEPEPEPAPEKPKPKPKPKKETEPPPPDPTDVPKDEPPPPPSDKPPPRRIVGVSLESTVSGGDGPSFATGNTRMGTTERTASDSKDVEALPKSAAPPPPAKANRAATRVPTGGGKLVQPKPKKKVKPPYPELYRAQNLEATVVIQLTVDPTGRPTNVRVVTPSPHEKFNEAALAAAKQMTFEPATKGGKPVPFTISVPFTFRLND